MLSIVIPAFNEATRITTTLARVTAWARARDEDWELVVVDDGSTDATRAVVAAAMHDTPELRLVELGENRGKGAAVRAGVRAARGARILMSDADLSTPIEEAERLVTALDAHDADLAIGSRVLDAPGIARKKQPVRRVVGGCFRLAVRVLAGRRLAGIKDTQCGFKLFRADVARQLFARSRIDGFAFDVEILLLAGARHRVVEVPVAWTHAAGSHVSLLRDPLRMLADVIRARRAIARPAPLLLSPGWSQTASASRTQPVDPAHSREETAWLRSS